MQMMVDSLSELRTGVAKLADQQSAHALSMERAIREMGNNFPSVEEHAELKDRVARVERTIATHNRVVWILGIIGGVCLTVATSLLSESAQHWIDAPRPHPIPNVEEDAQQ